MDDALFLPSVLQDAERFDFPVYQFTDVVAPHERNHHHQQQFAVMPLDPAAGQIAGLVVDVVYIQCSPTNSLSASRQSMLSAPNRRM